MTMFGRYVGVYEGYNRKSRISVESVQELSAAEAENLATNIKQAAKEIREREKRNG